MYHIGILLKKLRTEWGKSLKQISTEIGLSVDMLSKIERGKRKPTPDLLKELSNIYGVSYGKLLNIYLSDEIIHLLDETDEKESILRMVRKRLKSPNEPPIKLKSTSHTPYTDSLKPKRKRTKGTSRNKFKGFDYYIQSNGKLSKKNRKKLLQRSEIYLGEVISQYRSGNHPSDIPSELDPNLSDEELLDVWNDFYDKYGIQIPDFKEKVEKEQSREYEKQTKDTEDQDDEEINKQLDKTRELLKGILNRS